VAGECCLFLRGADTSSEKWRPYVEWARSLEAGDTVITFNYDRTVELAAVTAGKELGIVAGGQPVRKGLPRLLKMHGSVDWRRDGDLDVLVDDPEHALHCPSSELCIASPWQMAAAAISRADALVFVGYRFPQSDSVAREHLLRAIMSNGESNGGPAHVAVHTVLGPDINSPDARRLEGLLRYSLGRTRRSPFPGGLLPFSSPPKYYTLLPQPLYAEDFLGLVGRATILNPLQDHRPPT
jgi:hypothetical protein